MVITANILRWVILMPLTNQSAMQHSHDIQELQACQFVKFILLLITYIHILPIHFSTKCGHAHKTCHYRNPTLRPIHSSRNHKPNLEPCLGESKVEWNGFSDTRSVFGSS
jgi:hypothetical protein